MYMCPSIRGRFHEKIDLFSPFLAFNPQWAKQLALFLLHTQTIEELPQTPNIQS